VPTSTAALAVALADRLGEPYLVVPASGLAPSLRQAS
jgi:hypothetical protein